MRAIKTMPNPILEALPSRGESPSIEQENIMLKIRDNSGVAIVQDKGTALIVLGPKYQTAEGVFVSKDRNPQFKADVIVMNTNANAASWYSVLFHELAHATGTASRFNRVGIMSANVDAIAYCYEEIIAESVARRIMERMGLATSETREQSQRYINNYAMRIETLINTKKLALEIEQAESLVLAWLQGVEFKAA